MPATKTKYWMKYQKAVSSSAQKSCKRESQMSDIKAKALIYNITIRFIFLWPFVSISCSPLEFVKLTKYEDSFK